MLDAPIRKRIKNYPKDFTPPSGYFDTKAKTSHPQSEPVLTQTTHIRHNNLPRHRFNPHSLTTSTQLMQKQKQIENQSQQNITRNIITLNPQDNNKIFKEDTQRQTPLVNLHVGRKNMYINPDLLLKPRIQDNQNQQLQQNQQDEQVQEGTPGSIKKNSYQKPLTEQKPSIVIIPSKQAFSSKKLQSNQNIFYESVKNQYSNFNNLKSKKLPSFLRNGQSEPSGSFKLAKRSDSFMQSYLQTPKQKSQEKKKLIEFGCLLQQKKIDKLKAHINQIAFSKSKNKQKMAQTNQTQADLQQNFSKANNTYKVRPKTNFLPNSNMLDMEYPELGEGQRFQRTHRVSQTSNNISNQMYQTGQNQFSRAYSTSRNVPNIRKITISYKKTSLSNLKQIYSQLSKIQAVDIQVLVPNILMNIFFQRNLEKSQLYTKAVNIFQNLGIPTQNMTVKRYSNCIMMLSKNICILWHYDGKIYLGSWQIKYLDQGFKHGLGLQWIPNKYVYYGQFVQNKKQGLGIMKTKNQSYIGEWIQSKQTQNGYVINKNGNLYNSRQQNNSFNYNSNNNSYYNRRDNGEQISDRDPFM